MVLLKSSAQVPHHLSLGNRSLDSLVQVREALVHRPLSEMALVLTRQRSAGAFLDPMSCRSLFHSALSSPRVRVGGRWQTPPHTFDPLAKHKESSPFRAFGHPRTHRCMCHRSTVSLILGHEACRYSTHRRMFDSGHERPFSHEFSGHPSTVQNTPSSQ